MADQPPDGALPIEYFDVFCITNNADKTIKTLEAA